MNKLLMTTAIILPLAFAPVYAQETATAETPEAGMATGDAAASETAAEQDAAAAAEEALKAEVAASGKVAQQQAANELRLDWITDAQVIAADGTVIGQINDLIVDGESGNMIAAVIGVGGFLGIGEKQIAVPWDQLTINTDAREITSDLTKEEADVAPAYVFREQEPAPDTVTEGMADPAAVAEEGVATMEEAAGDAAAAAGDAASDAAAATGDAASDAAAATSEAAGDAASAVDSAIDSAVDQAGQAVDDAAAAIKGALNPDAAGEAATEASQ